MLNIMKSHEEFESDDRFHGLSCLYHIKNLSITLHSLKSTNAISETMYVQCWCTLL